MDRNSPASESQLRKLYQDAEAGRNLRQQIRQPRSVTSEHRRIHRRVLQSAALALCAGLSIAGRIRTYGRKPSRISKRNDDGFWEQRERRKDFYRAAGGRDSNAVPFPRPLFLLRLTKGLLRKRKLRPKNLCQDRKST